MSCLPPSVQMASASYITVTRKDSGELRPNFKPLPAGISIEYYAFEVYRKLRQALEGLVEEVRSDE